MARVSIVMATYNGRGLPSRTIGKPRGPRHVVPPSSSSATTGRKMGLWRSSAALPRVRHSPCFCTRTRSVSAIAPISCAPRRSVLRADRVLRSGRCLGRREDRGGCWRPSKIRRCCWAFHNATIIDRNRNKIACLYEAQSRIFAPLSVHPWRVVLGFTQMFSPLADRVFRAAISLDRSDAKRRMPGA